MKVVQLVNDLEKQIKKIVKPLDLHVKGLIGQWPFKKNPKLPKDLKQNVNWNQTLLNEGEVKLTPSMSFLSIEVIELMLTATDQHAALLQKTVLKNCKTGTRVQSAFAYL